MMAYNIRASVHYHNDKNHGTMQADMVLEVGVLYLD